MAVKVLQVQREYSKYSKNLVNIFFVSNVSMSGKWQRFMLNSKLYFLPLLNTDRVGCCHSCVQFSVHYLHYISYNFHFTERYVIWGKYIFLLWAAAIVQQLQLKAAKPSLLRRFSNSLSPFPILSNLFSNSDSLKRWICPGDVEPLITGCIVNATMARNSKDKTCTSVELSCRFHPAG